MVGVDAGGWRLAALYGSPAFSAPVEVRRPGHGGLSSVREGSVTTKELSNPAPPSPATRADACPSFRLARILQIADPEAQSVRLGRSSYLLTAITCIRCRTPRSLGGALAALSLWTLFPATLRPDIQRSRGLPSRSPGSNFSSTALLYATHPASSLGGTDEGRFRLTAPVSSFRLSATRSVWASSPYSKVFHGLGRS